ncbi:MAG: divalent-cation tolerance protein CutA [Patescibacteria group bacterium]
MRKSIFIYVTCNSEDEAKTIAKELLKKRVVACTNFTSIKSMYWWKGEIVEADECMLILKSFADKFDTVVAEVVAVHSYPIPCITKLDVTPNKAYYDWMSTEVYGS